MLNSHTANATKTVENDSLKPVIKQLSKCLTKDELDVLIEINNKKPPHKVLGY